jgi:hypothetical protein
MLEAAVAASMVPDMVLEALVVGDAELVILGPQFVELPTRVAAAVELHSPVAAVGIAELVALEL